jgi:hypothetical protein
MLTACGFAVRHGSLCHFPADLRGFSADSFAVLNDFPDLETGTAPHQFVHPPSVVPLLTWSCAIWSLADYSTPEGRMRGWDPNGCCLRHSLFPEDRTLAERLTGWLDGNNEDSPQPSAQAPSPTC